MSIFLGWGLLLIFQGLHVQAIQKAIQRGDLERVLFIDDGELPENFDAAQQWPECAKMINDIRNWD